MAKKTTTDVKTKVIETQIVTIVDRLRPEFPDHDGLVGRRRGARENRGQVESVQNGTKYDYNYVRY